MMRTRKFEAANVAPGDLMQYLGAEHPASGWAQDIIIVLSCKIHGRSLIISCFTPRFGVFVQEHACDLRQFCLEVQQKKIVNLVRDSW